MQRSSHLRIIDPDHALIELSDTVRNISFSYNANFRDDIEQAIWLSVVRYLREHGPTPVGLLVARAKGAALDELAELTCHGFRPKQSDFPPPSRITPKWIHGTTDEDPEIDCPAATIHPSASELHEQLLAIATEPDEIAIVRAGMAIAAASDAIADSVSLGTTAELIRFSNLSNARVKAAQKTLFEKFLR